MSETSNNSFIPKTANRTIVRKRSTRLYVLSYISYTLFFIALAGVGGVYLYEYLMQNQLRLAQEEVANAKDRFSTSDILTAQYFDDRLDTAWSLLETSISPSRIFTALEGIVVDDVTFGQFELSRSDGGVLTLVVSGSAETFDAAIVQRDLIAAHRAFALDSAAEFQYGTREQDQSEAGSVVSSESQVVVTYNVHMNESEIPYTPSTAGDETGGVFNSEAAGSAATTSTSSIDGASAVSTDGVTDSAPTVEQIGSSLDSGVGEGAAVETDSMDAGESQSGNSEM